MHETGKLISLPNKPNIIIIFFVTDHNRIKMALPCLSLVWQAI